MKKVIDRKVYNTETAEKLAHSREDYGGIDKFLYKTKKGNYFIYQEDCLGNGLFKNYNIEPLTLEEAIQEFENFSYNDQCVEFEDAFPTVKAEEA